MLISEQLGEALSEAISEPVKGKPGKYKYQGKVGVWRTHKGGDKVFYPDDKSGPLAVNKAKLAALQKKKGTKGSGAGTVGPHGYDEKAVKRTNKRAMKAYMELQKVGGAQSEADQRRLHRAHHGDEDPAAVERELLPKAKEFADQKHQAAEQVRKSVRQMADLIDPKKLPDKSKRHYDEFKDAVGRMEQSSKKGGPVSHRDKYKASDTYYSANMNADRAANALKALHGLLRSTDFKFY